ncbi:MAG TPA: hypothetical protein VFY82_12305 [Acidimicrobiales bacterium]|nr:hypothetical protein [Acidimicrobiales bacterium]
MRDGLQAAAVALGLLLGATPPAAAQENASPLLCAVTQLLECVDGGACSQIDVGAIGAPRFLRVDVAGERIHNPEAGEQAPGSTVAHSARVDGKLILQGTDPGIEEVRDGVGWTVAVAEDARRLVLTAAGDAVAYVGFGACLPVP